MPLRWVDEFTYLGVQVGDVAPRYLKTQCHPLLSPLTQRCTTRWTLPLMPVGWEPSKMIYLPLIISVWAGKPPSVAKHILYLPLSRGGLALPNFLVYYWAAVLVTLRWWFSQPRQNPAVTLEAALLGSYAALSLCDRPHEKHNPGVAVFQSRTPETALQFPAPGFWEILCFPTCIHFLTLRGGLGRELLPSEM